MFEHPNKYLKHYMYPGVGIFFNELQKQGISTAIYSDYPAAQKLKAMGLKADLVVNSTDPAINALKPAPNGILYILEQLGIQNKETCLFIGDRDELDGACARNAGVNFLLLDKTAAKTNFYPLLSNKIRSR